MLSGLGPGMCWWVTATQGRMPMPCSTVQGRQTHISVTSLIHLRTEPSTKPQQTASNVQHVTSAHHISRATHTEDSTACGHCTKGRVQLVREEGLRCERNCVGHSNGKGLPGVGGPGVGLSRAGGIIVRTVQGANARIKQLNKNILSWNKSGD